MNPVAATIADVDPAWLSGALGTEVATVAAERVGTGQVGATYRLAIGYADGAIGPGSAPGGAVGDQTER